MVEIMRDSERPSLPTAKAVPDAAPVSGLDEEHLHSSGTPPHLTTAINGSVETENGHQSPDPLSQVEVTVLLFASLRDAAKTDHIVVRVPVPTPSQDNAVATNRRLANASQGVVVTIADLLSQCGRQYPHLAPWLPHIRVAVNHEYADPHRPLAPDDEIAFLPPVSGGA